MGENRKFNLAIVGASGLVGRKMIQVLEERNFPVGAVKLYSSERSAGKLIKFGSEGIEIEVLNENSFSNMDIALFSAGKTASLQWAPVAAKAGCVAIDNSSAWRMHSDVPLVVPEVNPDALTDHHGIIANPNCSTIQLVVALKPIQDRWSLRRVVVSTYQSVSGAGQKGLDKLFDEIQGKCIRKELLHHPFAFNTVFHSIDTEDGFSEEENKMLNETRKIMGIPDLKMAVTCVRLPILGGHGESVNFETIMPSTPEEIREELAKLPSIEVVDNPLESEYPTVRTSDDSDEVYVGRIRKDQSIENGFYMWVVADNVRKGAATNAIQIAEKLIEKGLPKFEPMEQ